MLKMSKKSRKNCQDCKCLEDSGIIYCQLGYIVINAPHPSTMQRFMQGIPNPTPTEPCPKPLTNKDWIKARQNFKKHQTENINA